MYSIDILFQITFIFTTIIFGLILSYTIINIIEYIENHRIIDRCKKWIFRR